MPISLWLIPPLDWLAGHVQVLSEHLRLEQRDAAVRAQEACERDELAALEEGDERRRQERALQLKSFG
jgi:hypothetical protein